MAETFPKKIAVIGNGGGGKTTLAKELARKHALPLTHVDSIQYLSGMRVRDWAETSEILDRVAATDEWLIDGFGSFEVMTRRFERADKIVFVDFPLWRHYWWCTKRQIKSLRSAREELPAGCNEATLSHTIQLYRILWRVHFQIRPQLLEFLDCPEIRTKLVRISKVNEWRRVFEFGV